MQLTCVKLPRRDNNQIMLALCVESTKVIPKLLLKIRFAELDTVPSGESFKLHYSVYCLRLYYSFF